jgi:hypothetical protein
VLSSKWKVLSKVKELQNLIFVLNFVSRLFAVASTRIRYFLGVGHDFFPASGTAKLPYQRVEKVLIKQAVQKFQASVRHPLE